MAEKDGDGRPMTCPSCLKARAAAVATVRDAAAGRLSAVVRDVADLGAALAEKVESLRVRERLFGRGAK